MRLALLDWAASILMRRLEEGEGPGVFEIVEDHRGDAYRAVYTVRFANVVYVLHAFQKKSKSGIETPRDEVKLIGERLRRAQDDFERTRTA